MSPPGDSRLPTNVRSPDVALNDRGLMELPGDEGDVIYTEISTDAPMAPGTLRRASASNQRRWTNRTLTEFVLLMGALIAPQILAMLLATGSEAGLLLPFASILSGILVLCILSWTGPYGRLGLCGAPPRYFLEAILVAAVSVAVAIGYTQLLEWLLPDGQLGELTILIDELGLLASLFVIAVTPAILEEIIFRGMLQGRLMALFGRFAGYFITASAFAIVHQQPTVFIIHLGLGLYLGWLRERSRSLWPCMLMHFLYNGTLVTLTYYAIL